MAELRPQIIPNQIDTGAALIMSGRGNGARHLADGIAALQRQKEMERLRREEERKAAVVQNEVSKMSTDLASAGEDIPSQMQVLQKYSHLAFNERTSEGYQKIAQRLNDQFKIERQFDSRLGKMNSETADSRLTKLFWEQVGQLTDPTHIATIRQYVDTTGMPSADAFPILDHFLGKERAILANPPAGAIRTSTQRFPDGREQHVFKQPEAEDGESEIERPAPTSSLFEQFRQFRERRSQ